ncbi:hypothetical protein ACFU6K_17745 [Kitasatospora sp. NPDC057512]|uniref:hypothetical protein n=1 Tax=Kitasatospora sp. NPDC057512 TaxID=3346154 RepID=UPI0036871FCA
MRSEMPPPDFVADDEAAARLWNDHDLSSAEDLELSRPELMWVASCFMSTRQADEESEAVFGSDECEGCPSCTGEEPVEHGNIAADVLHRYVIDRVVTRFEVEPDLLQRSISAMREDGELEPELVAELGPLEADPHTVRQVTKLSRSTMEDLGPEAFRLAVLYLIRRIYIGGPSLPLDEQVRISWRIPEPGCEPAAKE